MKYPKELRNDPWDSCETKLSKKFWRLAWKVAQEKAQGVKRERG